MQAFFKTIYFWQVLILFIIGGISTVASVYWGERIPKHDGAGWDGAHYVALSSDFFTNINTVNNNTVKRFFPCLVIYSVVKVLGIDPTTFAMVNVFLIYNCILLLLSIYIWKKLVFVFELSDLANWLGFGALFISFFSLKFPFYYAPTVDTTGFLLSLLMLYFFKKGSTKGIYIITLIGAMSWPPIMYMSILLLAFHGSKNIPVVSSGNRINGILILIAALAFTGLATYLIHLVPQARGFCSGPLTYIITELYPLSLACTFFVFYFGLRYLLRNIDFLNIRNIFKELNYKHTLLSLLLFITVSYAYKLYGNMHKLANDDSIKSFLWNVLVTSNRQPFCFLVSHILYFGPVLILTIIYWKRIALVIQEEGLGMLSLILLSFIFLFDAESRHMLSFIPFITLYTIKTIEKELTKKKVALLLFISFVFSKCWLPLNYFPFKKWEDNYFMNFGHFYTDQVYLISFTIVSLVSIFLYFLFRSKKEVIN